MNFQEWYAARGLKFVAKRATKLTSRYGISAQRSINRIKESMVTLAKYGCAPTFFTPGLVVERYPRFIQSLQSDGAEIAVHSYQHKDLRYMELSDAIEQLNKALRVYEKYGIENYGFRCPYLGWSDELLTKLPMGMFDYSSNRAIWVGVPSHNGSGDQSVMFNKLHDFYRPQLLAEAVSTPWIQPNLFEIPVCVPDDLQLHDGLNLESEGISQAWIETLKKTYQRGELFNLIFHPELSSICRQSFEDLLQEIRLLTPAVWVARNRDISNWWKEKASFKVAVHPDNDGLLLEFSCTPRAVILARGVDAPDSAEVWDGSYFRLTSKTLILPDHQYPFIGLDSNAPADIVSFLEGQGYIVETSDKAAACGTYINADTLSRLGNPVQLVDYIEASPGPLVRFWRWPNGAKSALSITGDLDALTLLDYASRLFVQ
jgi:peptidoglycan/xylan/chitin deacetylase (PgdA/CDA1 family)